MSEGGTAWAEAGYHVRVATHSISSRSFRTAPAERPIRNSIDRPVAYSWRDGGPARRPGPYLPRGRSAWLRRQRRVRPWPPFPSPGDWRLVFVPRSGRYGARGKTWRHISQSYRVPPDRRLAPQHHEYQQRVARSHDFSSLTTPHRGTSADLPGKGV